MSGRFLTSRTSIQRRALALILPLLIVSMLAIGLMNFHILNQQNTKRSERFLRDRKNEILTIAEEQSVANYFHNIAYGLIEEAALYKNEMERYFKRFSKRYNAIEPIYTGIRYIDNQGREIAMFWEGRTGAEHLSVRDKQFFQRAIQLSPGEVYTSPIEHRMINATPIYWDEDSDGRYSPSELRGIIAADFIYPLSQFRNERLMMAGASLGITLLAIIISAMAVSMLLRRVTRPLHQLVGATRAISAGDLSSTISVHSDDEVGLLASSFNQMAEDLSRNIADKDRYARELQALNTDLEQKVKERTEELETTNDELQKANFKIKEADRLKSEFLANMSHELRTPMNAIIGFTKLVRRKTADILPTRHQENLEKVEISANQLLALINDILDLSKIEAGKMTMNICPFELAPLFDTCLSTVESLVRKGKVKLIREVPENLPELLSDQDKLKQIIINLLSNAIKFTEEGTVKLSANQNNGELQITVSDTGIGIPAEALEYIFDEFRQVDGSSTRKRGGTGLGLSITKKLTHLLGGRIQASSVQGEGSSFTIFLPLSTTEEQSGEEEMLDAAEESVHLDREKEQKLLLAIDDDPVMLNLLRQNLEEEGYYVVGALSADDGIRKAKELQPLAITLDILMPQKDGWEVINQLKVDPETRDIPIIVLSIIDNKELGYSLGAHDYLIKPFDKEAILSVLQRIPRRPAQQVLVIDDDPAAVTLLAQILQDEGYQVTGTHSGQEGLQVLESAEQDIIFLDLLMPEIDGFEVIRRIKADERWQNIPLIVVTAKDLSPSECEFLSSCVDSTIQKSGLNTDNLMHEIRCLLHEHQALCEEDIEHEKDLSR